MGNYSDFMSMSLMNHSNESSPECHPLPPSSPNNFKTISLIIVWIFLCMFLLFLFNDLWTTSDIPSASCHAR